MENLRQIDIDWDIHKLIEGERRGFDEPPYLALRRLLKMPPPTPEKAAPAPEVSSTGLPWMDSGVVVPHGSLAKMEYLRGTQVYEGKFLNGKLVVNGKSYTSLSAACDDLAITKNGTKPSLNGWTYWYAQFPGETKWQHLGGLREAARRNNKR